MSVEVEVECSVNCGLECSKANSRGVEDRSKAKQASNLSTNQNNLKTKLTS